jgi:hypothetical protein
MQHSIALPVHVLCSACFHGVVSACKREGPQILWKQPAVSVGLTME